VAVGASPRRAAVWHSRLARPPQRRAGGRTQSVAYTLQNLSAYRTRTVSLSSPETMLPRVFSSKVVLQPASNDPPTLHHASPKQRAGNATERRTPPPLVMYTLGRHAESRLRSGAVSRPSPTRLSAQRGGGGRGSGGRGGGRSGLRLAGAGVWQEKRQQARSGGGGGGTGSEAADGCEQLVVQFSVACSVGKGGGGGGRKQRGVRSGGIRSSRPLGVATAGSGGGRRTDEKGRPRRDAALR